MKRRHLLSTAFVLAAALSAFPASSQEKVVIGVPTGLSGANSTVAPAVVQSSELAVEEINKNGGILGRQVVLEVADDESGASGAQRAFDDLIFSRGANVIISMETSAARNAGLPIVERGKVPYIYTSLYEGHSCNKYLFVDGPVVDQMIGPIVDYFMDSKNAKTFFLVGSDYAFGRGMLEFSRKYIENRGGKVVAEEYQPMDATNWTAVISKMRRSNPDAVIMATAGGAPNVTLQRQYKAAGMTALVGNISVDELTAQSMGKDAADIYISASYLSGIDSEANKSFLARMKEKFGDKLLKPNDMSIPQYDAIYLYKEAVEKAGSLDTDAILKALPTVSFDSPRGRVQLNHQHHAPLTMHLGRVRADGSVEIIKSFENVSPGPQCPDL